MPKRPASQDLSHNPLLSKKFSRFKLAREEDFEPAQELALSILEDRTLAQHVRHITLCTTDITYYPPQALPYIASAEERGKETLFKTAINEQNWPDEDGAELLKRLMTVSSSWPGPTSHQLFADAVVALLLPILPNVEKWTVGDIDVPTFVGKAIKRAKDGIFGSISVRELELKPNAFLSDAAWADYSFPGFNIFKDLKGLESISGKGIGGIGIEDEGAYYKIPRQASGVKEIHLKDCELGWYCLSRIIDFSTGLEAFTYRFGGRNGDGSTSAIYSPGLAKALDRHRLTLRQLDLDIDTLLSENLQDEIESWKQEVKEEDEREMENKEVEDDSDGSADTLNSKDSKASAEKLKKATTSEPHFPNLTKLRIGIKLALRFVELAGKKTLAEWLPATLEELEIVGYRAEDSADAKEQIEEVIQRRDKILSNLKSLTGIDAYIENGQELDDEDGYVGSDDDLEENDDDAEENDDDLDEDDDGSEEGGDE